MSPLPQDLQATRAPAATPPKLSQFGQAPPVWHLQRQLPAHRHAASPPAVLHRELDRNSIRRKQTTCVRPLRSPEESMHTDAAMFKFAANEPGGTSASTADTTTAIGHADPSPPTPTPTTAAEYGHDDAAPAGEYRQSPEFLDSLILETLETSTAGMFAPDDWLSFDFSSFDQMPMATQPALMHRLGRAAVHGHRDIYDYQQYSFLFLDNFTKDTGIVSSFDCVTPSKRREVVDMVVRSNSSAASNTTQGTTETPETPETPQHVSLSSTTWLSWIQNPIVITLQQIVLLVKEVVTVKPRNSTISLSWSTSVEDGCLRFFSPARVAKFLELYWSIWHPNVNFLHRPTFDPASCKAVLVAAMAVMGACVSPDAVDNQDAKTWFNCVEEMVFRDDDFCSDYPVSAPTDAAPSSASVVCRSKLQALQAAYIVCLYQNWEGNDASKRRIRRYQFSTVVSVARDIGIFTAKHLDYTGQYQHEFKWSEYVAREELIRTFIWIFLMDTAFVIFNNLPHRMVIKEMKMHLATPEACFQAPTAEDCLREILLWVSPSHPCRDMLLSEAIENICTESIAPDAHQQFGQQMGPLNLFAIVSAFHYMIFQHQNLFGVESQLVLIRNGLRNWKAIWEVHAASATAPPHGIVAVEGKNLPPDQLWKRVGFVRYSFEYWLLGNLITDKIAAARDASPSRFNPGHGSEAPRSPRARSLDPILDKYDQTSMRQVNDLIAAFRQFQIG
ncbi:hypothetical protein MKZ38_008423 [Zalerion maritima]|uniref:Xylanolytic transcriptional activator regulatory domain-containing protein n=1 Tax=Zalerion maritima TaxID=339359 RepID=A0AAD5WP49_9PEZI|nr:hypothetical protein MKZ38_008423 [Zalerion maritima]